MRITGKKRGDNNIAFEGNWRNDAWIRSCLPESSLYRNRLSFETPIQRNLILYADKNRGTRKENKFSLRKQTQRAGLTPGISVMRVCINGLISQPQKNLTKSNKENPGQTHSKNQSQQPLRSESLKVILNVLPTERGPP